MATHDDLRAEYAAIQNQRQAIVAAIQLWHQIGWPTALVFFGYLLNASIVSMHSLPILVGAVASSLIVIFVRVHTWKLDEAVVALYPRLLFIETVLDLHFYRDYLKGREERKDGATSVIEAFQAALSANDETSWADVLKLFDKSAFPSRGRDHDRLTLAAVALVILFFWVAAAVAWHVGKL